MKGSEDLISRCGHMTSNLPQISGDRGLSRCDTEPEPSDMQSIVSVATRTMAEAGVHQLE